MKPEKTFFKHCAHVGEHKEFFLSVRSNLERKKTKFLYLHYGLKAERYIV